jgi:hypothetical protein
MSELTPFAQMPNTPQSIIAQVTQKAMQSLPSDHKASERVVKGLAAAAVHDLWESPVKNFIPVLALRDVRDELQPLD